MSKIVLLEDDNLIRTMYADKFKQAGYEVFVCSDGKSGLSSIKKHKPTIVLSDIMMPKMSGLEVLAAMKKEKSLAKIPFIFLTNLSRSDEDIKRGLELGAVGYLVKSDLTPEEIVAKTKEIVGAHQSSDELPESAQDRMQRAKKES